VYANLEKTGEAESGLRACECMGCMYTPREQCLADSWHDLLFQDSYGIWFGFHDKPWKLASSDMLDCMHSTTTLWQPLSGLLSTGGAHLLPGY
jgi:hypothetical protein